RRARARRLRRARERPPARPPRRRFDHAGRVRRLPAAARAEPRRSARDAARPASGGIPVAGPARDVRRRRRHDERRLGRRSPGGLRVRRQGRRPERGPRPPRPRTRVRRSHRARARCARGGRRDARPRPGRAGRERRHERRRARRVRAELARDRRRAGAVARPDRDAVLEPPARAEGPRGLRRRRARSRPRDRPGLLRRPSSGRPVPRAPDGRRLRGSGRALARQASAVTPGARRAPHPERGRHAAAALAYAALALWVARPVLRAPATAVLFPTAATRSNVATLVESDQRFVSGTIARNARSILASPASVLGFGSCYPLWQSFALGEHLFGESLLGVAPWLVVRDPIAVTNAVTLLTTWLAAVVMYALFFGVTRSPRGGFVARLVCAFPPGRVDNPPLPMVHGNLWAPLALLFADRLFATGRWGPAFGLAGALALALLESFYQILGLTILGGVFGVALAWRERASLVRLLPKLA